MAIKIPTIPPSWKPVERDYPISLRENILRTLNHEKPCWMPVLYGSSQMVVSKFCCEKAPNYRSHDHDWFGTYYQWSADQGSNTPMPGMFDEIFEWREKVKWPDLDEIDWSKELDGFVRDEGKALFMRFSNGPFERLHMFEGFEQALVDLLTEPEECREFFERLIDYKIDLFNHLRDVYPFDFIVSADDWGTERAPFFSAELVEETIVPAYKRFVDAVHARGTKFIAHCCGRMEAFLPYLVDVMHVDGLEIQTINDTKYILENYGDRVTIEYKADPNLAFNDEATEEQLRAHIRQIVDVFGAQAQKGAGVIMNLQSSFEKSYYIMEDELYHYSLEKYKDLNK